MAKLPHEQVLDLLRGQLGAIVQTMPAIRGLIATIIWDQSLGSDLPPGVVLFRPGLEVDPNLVLVCIQQNAKLASQLSGNIQNWAETVVTNTKHLQEKVRELETQLEQLRAQQTEGNNTTEATRSPDAGDRRSGGKAPGH